MGVRTPVEKKRKSQHAADPDQHADGAGHPGRDGSGDADLGGQAAGALVGGVAGERFGAVANELALVAAIVNAVSVGLGPVNGILAWIASSVVFWILMVKWFDVDLFGAVIIVVVNMIISFAAFIFLIAAH